MAKSHRNPSTSTPLMFGTKGNQPVTSNEHSFLKSVLKYKVWIIAIVLICIFGAFLCKQAKQVIFEDNKRLILRNIIFNETEHYATDRCHAHISIATLLSESGIEVDKTNLLQLDLKDVSNCLMKYPLIGRTTLEKVLPDTLKINFKERHPVARLVYTGLQTPVIYPLAIWEDDLQGLESYKFILLPQTIQLFNEQKNTYENWDYALYPKPFNKQIINSDLPDLYDFNGISGEIKPGTVFKDKKLAAAIRLLKLTGPTSPNQLFNIQEIRLVNSSTIRARVKPFKSCHKIKSHAYFDFDYDTINEELVTKTMAYLRMAETNDSIKPIQYLNACSSNAIYSSTDPVK